MAKTKKEKKVKTKKVKKSKELSINTVKKLVKLNKRINKCRLQNCQQYELDKKHYMNCTKKNCKKDIKKFESLLKKHS
jgi:hypothetical protein